MNTQKEIQKSVPRDYISRELTGIIKGIAIVLMFIHHCFTFPSWWVDGISYPYLEKFASVMCEPLKICVSVFAFLSGYFYCFGNETKGYKYSMKKTTDLLIVYWIIYIPYLVLAVSGGYYEYNRLNFFLELFALYRPVMTFCWYVRFYIVMMLLLPVTVKLLNRNIVLSFLVGTLGVILLGCGLEALWNYAMTGREQWIVDYGNDMLNDLKVWFPCTISGYIFARFSLFDVLDCAFKNKMKFQYIWRFILICILFMTFWGRKIFPFIQLGNLNVMGKNIQLSINMDIIYAPFFIYVIINLFNWRHLKITGRILNILGKYSLYIWFLHCIFFNVSKTFYQPYLYLPKFPVLVVGWGLLICCIAAKLIDVPVQFIIKMKNHWFDMNKYK